MNTYIDQNKYYFILDEQHICCDETQFVYICKSCEDPMGCYYCSFDYTEQHDCDTVQP